MKARFDSGPAIFGQIPYHWATTMVNSNEVDGVGVAENYDYDIDSNMIYNNMV